MAKFTEEQIIKIIEGRPVDVSVKDYCAEVDMHPRVFYYHRSRLAAIKSKSVQDDSRSYHAAKDASAAFIPLKIKNGGIDSPLALVELPSKANISIYDPAILPMLFPLLGMRQ